MLFQYHCYCMKIMFISVLVFLFVSVKVQLKCLLQHIIYFVFFGYMMGVNNLYLH